MEKIKRPFDSAQGDRNDAQGDKAMRKILDYAVGYKEFNEAERSIVHYITTPDRDRGGDVVNPFGMIDRDFSKSPTVFYNHRYMLPVAKSLWRKAEDKGVLAKTQFSSVEYAQDVYRLHKEGIINTWSIGFRIPQNPDAVKYDEKTGTLFINLWELIEYSSAPIAMNPNCVDVEKDASTPLSMTEMIYRIKSFCRSEEMKCEIERLKDLKMEGFSREAGFRKAQKDEKTVVIAGEDPSTPCLPAGTALRVTAEEVKKMFAGAISRVTGRRIKI